MLGFYEFGIACVLARFGLEIAPRIPNQIAVPYG
jgi:hypothetical protein